MMRGVRWRTAVVAVVSAAGLLAPVTAGPAGAQTPPPVVDYDTDDDGLIEVSSLAQLNAIRWDLDGDGTADVYPPSRDGRTGHDPDGATKIAAAFPDAAAGMGCPADGCDGYELTADLDFDTNGNGQADSGDEYWNDGRGWIPLIGGERIDDGTKDDRFGDQVGTSYYGARPHSRARMFTAEFEGNAHTIANLHIDDARRWYVGLFGYIGPGAHVRNLGLSGPTSDSGVHGNRAVGALAGVLEGGRVSGVSSDVDVSVSHSNAGGLIGDNWRQGLIVESYATGDVSGSHSVGGLVGMLNQAGAAAVYATGSVTASTSIAGGLVGFRPGGYMRAAYATGDVTVANGYYYNGSNWYLPNQNNAVAGGLTGLYVHGNSRETRANYSTGQVTVPDGHAGSGGLVGLCRPDSGDEPKASYWDTEASGRSSGECATGYTTAQLQAPTGYGGIYSSWNLDIDGDGTGDDPWDFGTSSEYPVLKYCAAKPGIDTADGLPYCPLQAAGQRSTATTALGALSAEDDDDPVVLKVYTVDPEVVAKVESLASQTQHGTAHVNRWRRVLVAFGEHDGTGVSGGPMTAAQAQQMADAHSSPVWDEVVAELTALEAAPQQTPPPPPPLPVVSVTSSSGGTEGGPVSFTVTASPAPSADLAVGVTVATSGDFGFGTAPTSVTVPISGSVTVTVTTTDDDADEPDGSVTLTLIAGSGYTVGALSSERADVADDDAPAGYTVDPDMIAKVQALAAQTQHGTAHVNRWNRVLVAFGAHDGTGVTGGAMTAADARQMADTHSSPVWDEVAAELAALETAAQTTPPPPPPPPEVSVTAGSGVTEGGTATFTVSASSAPTADLDVTVTITAAGGYGATTGTRTVTIPTTGSVTVAVATSDDTTDEPDGSVTATVDAGSGYIVSATQGAATVAVADDDDPPVVVPVVSITGGSGVIEGGTASFTVSASPAPSSNLDVSVTVSQSGDYGATTGARTVTIPTSGSATLTIATADDGADEPDGSVTTTLASGSGYIVSATLSAATVSVADDDPPPVEQDQPDQPDPDQTDGADQAPLVACAARPTLLISSPTASRSDATVDFEVSLSCIPSRKPTILLSPLRDGSIGQNIFVNLSADQTSTTVTVGIGAEHQLGLVLAWNIGLANDQAQGDVAYTD